MMKYPPKQLYRPVISPVLENEISLEMLELPVGIDGISFGMHGKPVENPGISAGKYGIGFFRIFPIFLYDHVEWVYLG